MIGNYQSVICNPKKKYTILTVPHCEECYFNVILTEKECRSVYFKITFYDNTCNFTFILM